MLESTFIHVPGIGEQTEKALWSQGCSSWDTFLSGSFSCGSASRDTMCRTLEKSRDALAFGEHQFFAKKLRQKHAWRAYDAFKHSCAYLDIETTGSGGQITVVGIWDSAKFHILVEGEDLGNFPDIISNYSMIVTFFGTGFDIPVLQKRFKNFAFDQIHVDLCPMMRSLGYRGGLKRIEQELGIEREPGVAGLNGYDAVKLWRRYKHLRDDRAMETLIAYNRADCVNLQALAERAFAEMKDATLRPEDDYARQAG